MFRPGDADLREEIVATARQPGLTNKRAHSPCLIRSVGAQPYFKMHISSAVEMVMDSTEVDHPFPDFRRQRVALCLGGGQKRILLHGTRMWNGVQQTDVIGTLSGTA